MKILKKASLLLAFAVALAVPSFTVKQTQEAQADFTTTATKYTKASDVKYDTSGKYLANWGARGEDCVFLSKYAESFYTGSYTYEMLSMKSGGSSQSNASSSALYSSLQSLMKSKHSYQTSYSATKEMYRYTDCVSNNYSNISSFYSGKVLNGAWDGAATWNREHTWPNSKGLGGNDENDIMMLRPTWVQENSSRGNTAYGQSSGYYDPNGEGANVRGDCARIFLYVYVRWGNTSYAWGKSGVMESMSVLLKWMEEDPVDTWEMGRNDAVQDITGTRNVFVDYPEFAWQLFGKETPDDLVTPSGEAMSAGGSSGSSSSSSSSSSASSSSSESSMESSFEESSSEESVSADSSSKDSLEDYSEEKESDETGCTHEYSDWYVKKQPTETEYGERIRTCIRCGDTISELLPKTTGGDVNCEHEYSDWYVIKEPTTTETGKQIKTCIRCGDTCVEILSIVQDPQQSVPDIPNVSIDSDIGELVDSVTEGCNASMSGMVLTVTLLGACAIVMKKRED